MTPPLVNGRNDYGVQDHVYTLVALFMEAVDSRSSPILYSSRSFSCSLAINLVTLIPTSRSICIHTCVPACCHTRYHALICRPLFFSVPRWRNQEMGSLELVAWPTRPSSAPTRRFFTQDGCSRYSSFLELDCLVENGVSVALSGVGEAQLFHGLDLRGKTRRGSLSG